MFGMFSEKPICTLPCKVQQILIIWTPLSHLPVKEIETQGEIPRIGKTFSQCGEKRVTHVVSGAVC